MRRIKAVLEFVILFLLNGIMLWFFHSYLNLLFLVGMIVFFLYAFFSAYYVRSHVSIDIQVPNGYMEKKTNIVVRIHVKNDGFLPLVRCRIQLFTGNVFLSVCQENWLTVPVPIKNAEVIEYPLYSEYVGNIEVSVKKVLFEDLLSIHCLKKQIDITKNIYILPNSVGDEAFSLNDFQKGMDEAQESKLKGSDFSDVSQVREYIPGDAMKNIHWKLSAKKDDIMVKERLQMSSRKLLIVLSVDRNDPKIADETVEMAYRIGVFFISNRVPVTLYFWSNKSSVICEEDAESREEWEMAVVQALYHRAGCGMVEEQFKSMCPGRGYVLVDAEGVTEK